MAALDILYGHGGMPAGAAAKAEQKDIFHLSRFIDAQKGVYPTALAELQAGRKRTHWMWFIFPQLAGLGRSSTAQHFALSGQAEALAFLGHSCLGQRLVAATQAVMDQEEDLSAREIFSTPDDLKFLSSMTLFATLSETAGLDASLFRSAIRKFYDGKPDLVTIELLKQLP